MVRENFKNLKPCAHGADIFDAAYKSGFNREEIIDFSSNVTPLGPSIKAIEAIKNNLNQIPLYPDSTSTDLRTALAKHYGNIKIENLIVGNGSTELIYLFVEAFTQKGDVVLLPA
ncbi:MAG: threonine-phosphate decarboxylase, partial [Crenarchaeota archaeon]|nr:threonine-phosphate decarboxylase [Thermoproteota archaeon]